jgi:hypothetical protein
VLVWEAVMVVGEDVALLVVVGDGTGCREPNTPPRTAASVTARSAIATKIQEKLSILLVRGFSGAVGVKAKSNSISE